MIRKDRIKFADGSIKTHVRVVKSYRPGPGQSPRQATIKSFGYLEDAEDPVQFMHEVEQFDQSQKRETRRKQLMINIPTKRRNNDSANKTYNYGYRFLESIYKSLGIKDFFDEIPFRGNYSLNDVFEFLTLERIMRPDSKRGTFQSIRQLYGKHYDFSLADVYRALDKFSDCSVELQQKLNARIKALIGRDQTYAFYDVTNYYFDTDFPGPPGTYQQKGVSKEHRLSPIIGLGLFMDSNHLPIAMSTFPGNTSDSITLKPMMSELRKHYKLGRLIVVADKGMNSKDNLELIVSQGDGYVVSQTLKGTKGKRYHEMLFDEKGYVGTENFKYKLFEEEYESAVGRKKSVTRKRKVLIYWNRSDMELARKKRQEKVQRANKQLKNNAYSINHRATEYVTTTNVLRATGEISDQAVHRIDYDKINEEERFDGYFCIITSELDYDHKKIIEVYSQLWHIEESFKITKSDLQTRPIYVRTQKHIEGHMLICFTALLIARLMQYRLGDHELSINRIKNVLNACTCSLPNDHTVLIHEVGGQLSFKERLNKHGEMVETLGYDESKDQVHQDYRLIQKAFGVSFDYAASTREDFNKYLKSIRFKIPKPKKKRS